MLLKEHCARLQEFEAAHKDNPPRAGPKTPATKKNKEGGAVYE